MKSLGNIILIAMVVTLIAACVGCASSKEKRAYLQKKEGTVELGNRHMTVYFSENRFEVENHLTGRKVRAESDGFEIGIEGREPLTIDSFDLKDWKSEKMKDGIRLVRNYRAKSGDIDLRIVYELGDGDFFMRRCLELSSEEPLDLRKADVWKVKVEGKATHQGFGEPVFLDDTFWGLEYPAGRNSYRDGMVVLSQYPGRSAKEFVSKTAVMGVAPRGEVAEKFREYVETFRITPEETSLFVNYNTWWTLMPPTEENSLALVEVFRKNLYEPYGESIDTFTVDDGWEDNSTLWEFDKGFPDGFSKLKTALNSMNTKLGLWISPSSRYGHAEPLSKKGYLPMHYKYDLCLASEKYRKDMTKRVTELINQNDIAFVKFDGFGSRCDEEGHSHLPGEYSIDANTDSFIELIEAVHKVKPDIYLDLTCGIWLSPWWLQYADSFWGNIGGDYPNPRVPAPIHRDSATTTRDGIFRQRCIEHPGFPPAAIEHLGIIIITPEKWEDNAMTVLGRGCRLLTLYIDPKHFLNPEHDWAFLASALKWARHNAKTLQSFEMILGDPMKQEPYGYAHIGTSRGVVMVRNPYIEPKTMTIDVRLSDPPADAKDPNPSGEFIPKIVYPREETLDSVVRFGDSFDVMLQAYETVIIQLEPVNPDSIYLTGIRCHETSRSGSRMTYDVYSRVGEDIVADVVTGDNIDKPVKAGVNGKEIAVKSSGKYARIVSESWNDEVETKAGGIGLKAETADGMWSISGTCRISLPGDTEGTIYVLAEPKRGYKDVLACTAQVNGSEVDVRNVDPPHRGGWTWFLIDLPSGDSRVSLTISSVGGGGIFEGEVGCWLWAEYKLRKRTVILDFDGDLPPTSSGPLPMPINQEYEREVVTLQPMKKYSAGEPWPEPKKLSEFDEDVVYLDLAIADKDTQGWGTLKRRQSVWEREMSIGGRKFARGLGTHADGTTVFNLPEDRFKTFRCMVGHDDATGDNNVVFQVFLDDKKVYDSGPMMRGNPAKDVEVDVKGAKVLELRCLDGGDGYNGDHCDWADVRLVR